MIVLVPVGQFEKSPNIPEAGRRPTIDITFSFFFLKCNVAEKLIFFTNDLFILWLYMKFRTCTLVIRQLNKNSSEISSVSTVQTPLSTKDHKKIPVPFPLTRPLIL